MLAINVGAAADTTQTTWAELGLPGEGSYTATDIWTGRVAPADGAAVTARLEEIPTAAADTPAAQADAAALAPDVHDEL